MPVKLNKGTALSLLDLTPMIDMVFNLLIFFMVVSQFASEERALKVDLPEGTLAMPLTSPPKVIYINIDQSGRYYINSRRLDERELARYLRQAAIDNPTNQTANVRADKRCPWDFVATAMRLCNEAGIREYSASLTAGQP
ncbi:MAG: biopolymer transporter ExbD [Planctomycetaceae bacterium]|nr:biopolymer transporter ExbD [Planctomycetaceae bacterium]